MTLFERFRFSFNGVMFGRETEEYTPPYVHGTTCCALCILSAKNYHSFREIKKSIDAIHKHSNSQNFETNNRVGGERSIMCIVSPGEYMLEKNLIHLGFKCVAQNLPRRKGYPKGTLKMYLLSFEEPV